jgi:hypothetical protein
MQITNIMFINAPTIGGNSGGPIVNANGDVIGILTYGRSSDVGFSGGSNQSVLSATLPILKTGDNKQKLYLGLKWTVPSPFELESFYPNQTDFDTNGVLVTVNVEHSPFNNITTILMGNPNPMIITNFLLLKCVINGTTIEFGNKLNQRTPGVLLYYPINTQVTIYYKDGFNDQINQQVVTLNKTYANVPANLDGFLQTGYSTN